MDDTGLFISFAIGFCLASMVINLIILALALKIYTEFFKERVKH